MKLPIRFLTVAALALGLSSIHAQVISSNFVSPGSGGAVALAGTQVGLTANQPGGSWIWGAGWNWSAPSIIPLGWGGPYNAASLGEEKTSLGISLSSAGTYTKPTQFTISAALLNTDFGTGSNHHDGGAGLGFWSTMDPTGGANNLNSATDFTGLVLKPVETFDGTIWTSGNGVLQLFENGTPVGSGVDLGFVLTPGTLYNLSYSVNTATGALSVVTLDGNAVAGFSSTAFTDSATAFTGGMSGNAGRAAFNNFTVVPEPATWALLLGGGVFVAYLRRTRRS